MKLQFLGGAQTVTGSKSLITVGKHRLLVDCGLFQGLKELRLKNREPLPLEPRQLDAVILTHAHLDHSGYLPLLVKNGFRGKIFCSAPTRDLAELLLNDSAKIQEEDAEFANRHEFSKHHPAEPLYTREDAQRTIDQIESVPADRWMELPGRIRYRLTSSSHILGSTFVELEAEGVRVAFSGDLGRESPLLYPPPATLESADYLVLESTYGDRNHLAGSAAETSARLGQIVCETYERGGVLLIPSFAVGRVQDLLLLLSDLNAQQKIPSLPIYLDSPMGLTATQIFSNHPRWHGLTPAQVDRLNDVAQMVRSQEESIRVMRDPAAAIVIAGSGMITGGRILHHLAARLGDERNTVLLVGFQAAGTRGRLLRDGASELKMHGRYIPVRARIEEITGLSAHADQSETLTWLKGFRIPPKRTFINHGEPQASDALQVKIRDMLGWSSEVPQPLQEYTLEAPAPEPTT